MIKEENTQDVSVEQEHMIDHRDVMFIAVDVCVLVQIPS